MQFMKCLCNSTVQQTLMDVLYLTNGQLFCEHNTIFCCHKSEQPLVDFVHYLGSVSSSLITQHRFTESRVFVDCLLA